MEICTHEPITAQLAPTQGGRRTPQGAEVFLEVFALDGGSQASLVVADDRHLLLLLIFPHVKHHIHSNAKTFGGRRHREAAHIAYLQLPIKMMEHLAIDRRGAHRCAALSQHLHTHARTHISISHCSPTDKASQDKQARKLAQRNTPTSRHPSPHSHNV